ncbi:class I SAM-dependent methyltransferase [Halapricum salinum]|uniref:Class I SAM-dependent methyltransferase n=1 Tax=Halapricum salinum TaxID=1457250 RepID=A0A4D6HB32_9EURY|nr:methyltransferase domain-containing protein [Halapricum salinum]QCC51149.1 class I SAM-dependent methyltransferase [Halapricum salinum]
MVDKRTVRDGYDALVDDYAAQRTDDSDDVEALASFLDDLPDGSRLLDAGCGQGIPVLASLDGVSGVGLDISHGQLARASENAPAAALAQGDMTRLPFADDAFDAVTALWSVIHVPEGDHRTVFEEFARVLRPGGRLLLVEGTDEWRGTNPDWLGGGAAMEWHIAGPEATREQLRAVGFEILVERTIGDSLEEDAAWTLFEADC